MGDIFSLARKMKRAARNGTGTTFTADEMAFMLHVGVFDTISALEVKELQARCPAKANSQSEISGSTSGGTVSRPTFGRSPATETNRGPLSIAALSAGL